MHVLRTEVAIPGIPVGDLTVARKVVVRQDDDIIFVMGFDHIARPIDGPLAGAKFKGDYQPIDASGLEGIIRVITFTGLIPAPLGNKSRSGEIGIELSRFTQVLVHIAWCGTAAI